MAELAARDEKLHGCIGRFAAIWAPSTPGAERSSADGRPALTPVSSSETAPANRGRSVVLLIVILQLLSLDKCVVGGKH